MKMFDCNQGFKPRDISIIFFSSVYSSCMSILVEQRAVLSLDCCCMYLLNFIFFPLFVHTSFSTAGATHGVSVIQVYGWTQGGDRWFMTWTSLIYCVIFFFFSAGRKSLRPGSVVWRLSACTVLMVGYLCPNKLIKKYSKRCYTPFIWDKNDWLSAMT